ncbi:MAG: CvpA family protein [Gammaproteobacteria bacterium]
MHMIWIDYSIVGIIIFSLLIGILRGFVKEVLAIATWIAAIWVGFNFSRPFAALLETQISHPTARLAAAFGLLILVTLILGAMIGFLLNEVMKKAGLSGADRFIGMFFGIARGVLLVSILILLAGFLPLPQEPWWKESQLIPHFQRLALWLRHYIPSGLAGYINY